MAHAMSTATNFDEGRNQLRRFLWFLLVALTLGLCLLAHKRQVELIPYTAEEIDAVAHIEVDQAKPQSSLMVINVKQVRQLPIWHSGTLESNVMHDDYYDRR